jgi:glycine/D-amino acid oxidase-like deaminating enzyme
MGEIDTGKTAESTWLEGYIKPSFPTLEENKEADVVIVGGGIAGMLTAYLLASEGRKVIVIEKNKIGEGTTAYTTGFLTESLDTSIRDLYNIFGREDAHSIIDAHRKAIDLYEEIIKRHNIECEFVRCCNYIYADTEKESIELEEELIYYKKIKSDASFKEDGSLLGFPNKGYIEMVNQGKIHILKFLSSLTIEARKLGVEIYENTEANEIEEGKVATSRSIITAEWVVVLTYWPHGKALYFRKGTYISYIFELELLNNKIPIGTYEDTKEPYHYFRIDQLENKTRAIVGGEDHRKQIPMDETKNYNALYKYAKRIFGKDNFRIVRKWNGPILEPFDGVGLIGRAHPQEKILYATGFSGNGITYSGITAMLLTDIILGNKNELERIISPMRVPPMHALFIKARDYLTVMANGAGRNSINEKKTPEF